MIWNLIKCKKISEKIIAIFGEINEDKKINNDGPAIVKNIPEAIYLIWLIFFK